MSRSMQCQSHLKPSHSVIVVADPDEVARQALRFRLEDDGYLVREVGDGRSLLALLHQEAVSLVVLDLDLPDVGGLDLCRQINTACDVPLVALTANQDEVLRLTALELYVEDYIQKPPNLAEVAVRIKRVLKRGWIGGDPDTTSFHIDDDVWIDVLRRQSHTPLGVYRLSPIESRLLEILWRNGGQVLPNELLIERVWKDGQGSVGSLWEHVRRLRRKLGDDAAHPRYIANEPGIGYRFCVRLWSENPDRFHPKVPPRVGTEFSVCSVGHHVGSGV